MFSKPYCIFSVLEFMLFFVYIQIIYQEVKGSSPDIGCSRHVALSLRKKLYPHPLCSGYLQDPTRMCQHIFHLDCKFGHCLILSDTAQIKLFELFGHDWLKTRAEWQTTLLHFYSAQCLGHVLCPCLQTAEKTKQYSKDKKRQSLHMQFMV